MPRLRVIDDEAIERPFNKEQFKRLLTFLKPYKGRIAFALCLMVISAMCSLALPMLMSKAIDQIDAGNAHNFPFFLIAMVICAAVGSICVRYRARIMDTAGRSAIADMRQTLFDHIQDLSFNFFDSRSAGKIMVRVINDVNSLNDLFTNGIVNVSAKDMGTGKEQSIKIQSSSGLSEEDIQRLVREAEAHASEDKKKQETIEARNHADSLIYGTEKSLNDLGDKVDAAVKSDVEGKIAAIRYARENRIPFFGICLGMQCAVIEFARHVAGLEDANSEEFDPLSAHKVIYLMTEWFDFRTKNLEKRDAESDKGGTMRLGAYPCKIIPDTRAFEAYGKELVEERHRHRYEFNNAFKDLLEEKGMVFSGTAPDGSLMEIVELPDHPWFLGCQFHPEFKSRPMAAHPLFREFIKAAKNNHKK